MKQLWLLIKLNLSSVFGINIMLHGKDEKTRAKTVRTFVLFIIVAIVVCVQMFGYFYAIGSSLEGEYDAVIAMAAAAGAITVFISSILSAAATLFSFKDYDAISSLPIPASIVALSRILKLYGNNMFFMVFVTVPAYVAYCMFAGFDIATALRFIVSLLCLPLIPIALSSALGTLIARLAAGFRHKNAVKTVLSFIFLGGIMALSFSASSLVTGLSRISLMLRDSVYRTYPPARWFTDGVVGDGASLLLFVGISLAVFLIYALAVARLIRPLNAALRASLVRNRGAKAGDMRVSTVGRALFVKEMKLYFSSSLYVTNTAIGPVILLLGGIALVILGADKLTALMQFDGAGDVIAQYLPYALLFMATISVTTAASISIEHNGLWQLKMLPISVRDVFKAKLMVSFVLGIPAIIVSALLVAIALKPQLQYAALMLLLPLSGFVAMTLLGLRLNLAWPKFDWKTEAEIVKQGMPVMITVFSSMGLVIVAVVMMAVLSGVSAATIGWAFTGLMAVLALCVWRNLATKGEDLFKKL